MRKHALLIAYHFPPFAGSSGVHRTLKTVQYLPDHGWSPILLSVTPRAYLGVSDDLLAAVPESTIVKRAFCLDTARHLSVLGRYPRALALPDRWSSWWPMGVVEGLKLIRRYRPRVIWSTFPIATAQLIGLTLHRITGIPWVADIRDLMTEPELPKDPWQRRAVGWIEKRCITHADAVVFTTPGAAELYRERYPDVPRDRMRVIENGYDEETFEQAELAADDDSAAQRRPLRLVHSGILYPEERDPTEFFAALKELKQAGRIDSSLVRIVLRATGHDEHVGRLIAELGVGDLVELAPHLPYAAALGEMLSADGLLIFQASNCNQQIPAKVYEYFRAGRPIFALTDDAGDTAGLLRRMGIDTIAPLDDRRAIAERLTDFLDRLHAGTAPRVLLDAAAAHSRRSRTRELAALFDEISERRDA